MKSGRAVIIGRPNCGKSTLLNNLIGTKVSITSPKPQTTRTPVEALYEDEVGQIIMTDTPGFFTHKMKINAFPAVKPGDLNSDQADVVLFVIDPTRRRGREDNKTLGIARRYQAPKILVVNKIDIKSPNYYEEFAFLENECDEVIRVSALKKYNLNLLIDAIFRYLPENRNKIITEKRPTPLLNLDSRTFIAELIREKIYLLTREEVPYSTSVSVAEISERANGVLYVRAVIQTIADRYKAMLIGKNGAMIKEIGVAARKELETATGKKVFIDLTVVTPGS